MSREHEPFAEFEINREPMLRTIRNHRRAAHGIARDSDEYEQIHIAPVPIDHDLFRSGRINLVNAKNLLNRATLAWNDALRLGERYGFRNAQTTVIAPTGTIGLLMDCDTTGVEPDFALTKFKKLAGGGYFKIANQSLRPALSSLGYPDDEIDNIVTYVMGTLSLDTRLPDGVNGIPGDAFRDLLSNNGYTPDDLIELENQLPTVFELSLAFNAWSMPKQVLTALGVDIKKAREGSSFNGLIAMGLTEKQIAVLNRAVCGTQTVEGAPHLTKEHLPVFDCASTCGLTGTRSIAADGHIRMMAAAQPFISGAISKTINLPNESEVEHVADAYRLSWELGLKANALYRDGSKLSQPLNTKTDANKTTLKNSGKSDSSGPSDQSGIAGKLEAVLGEASTEAAVAESATSISSISFESAPVTEVAVVERIVERVVDRPLRRRLPDTRASITHRFNVSGHEGYLTVGLYDNGGPGELFITMAKEGSTIGGLMDCLGTAISVALQYGVPVESLVNKFAHQRFEPMGMTTNSDIPFAKSLVDYIFRWMGMEFVPGYRENNAPKRPSKNDRSSNGDTDAPRSSGAPEAVTRSIGNNGNGTTSPNPLPTRAVAPFVSVTPKTVTTGATKTTMAAISALDQSHAAMMSDAPACDQCGAITMRNGSCYRCMNCGNSMGCS
jgi:ribonucleoside-diphosphate reductase alpha chain